MNDYKKIVHDFFIQRNGINPKFYDFTPVYLEYEKRQDQNELIYPLYFNYDKNELGSLSTILKEIIHETFEPEVSKLLISQYSTLQKDLWDLLFGIENTPELGDLSLFIINTFKKIGTEYKELDSFVDSCAQLEKKLSDRKVMVMKYSQSSVFELLNIQLQKKSNENRLFMTILKRAISGVKDILQLNSGQKEAKTKNIDFAADLISFDMIDNLSSVQANMDLSEKRLNSLKNCLETLSDSYKSYTENPFIIFTSKYLAEEYSLKNYFPDGKLVVAISKCTEKSRKLYDKEIEEFTRLIYSLRLVDLEINQQYDEDLHDPYFEKFDTTYLRKEDIQNFRPIILIDEGKKLMSESSEMLSFFSNDAFIKIVSVNNVEDILNFQEEEKEKNGYLEISSLAAYRRNAFVHQEGVDDPISLFQTFNKGINGIFPAFWNVLVSAPDSVSNVYDLIKIRTAIASRCFPRLVFDFKVMEKFKNHISIDGNQQYEYDFPRRQLEVKTDEGITIKDFFLTMADFFALSKGNREQFLIIPSQFHTDDYIPIGDYLQLLPADRVHKIPFIWGVNASDELVKMAVPINMVERCRQMLEYWKYLQELAGPSRDQLLDQLENEKKEWEQLKEKELIDQAETLKNEYQQTRSADIEKAIKQILFNLLEDEVDLSKLLAGGDNSENFVSEQVRKVSQSEKKKSETSAETMPQNVVEATMENLAIKSEVWVESEDCTSCSDCIDALPTVFKYNSNKQAYVHNPKGGPFAKIVSAAEKCPARCIHPGLPHDPQEKDLEKWIKRAEKYN